MIGWETLESRSTSVMRLPGGSALELWEHPDDAPFEVAVHRSMGTVCAFASDLDLHENFPSQLVPVHDFLWVELLRRLIRNFGRAARMSAYQLQEISLG